MSNNGSEFTLPPLLVSTLDVQVEPRSRKVVETIIVNAGTIKREIHRAISPGCTHREPFNPPLEIPLHTNILVSIHYRGTYRGSVFSISLDPKTVLSEASEKDGKQVFRQTTNNVEVAFGIRSLPPTVRELVASCSRFRVLIIGKSGVGKSSLINNVFGVSDVHVSDTTRGEARIDQEHIAADNELFVVHDSCGFEAGDDRNLARARDFIVGRRCRGDLKDQLHAVWLCLEIPFAGGRVLETGVEDFLKDRDHILGDIPLVVVFTKLDSLVNTLKAQALQAGQLLDDDALEERTHRVLEKRCFEPIRTAVGNNDVTYVAVSSEEEYKDSLSELVEKTTRNIEKHIKNEAAHYIATMAQRVNITLKVTATIAFGEKRYWNMLTESPDFRGHTMKACLDVLHRDIVTVWNFKDPQNSLHDKNFKEALLNTPKVTRQSNVSVIVALVTIIGLAGTSRAAFPIVVGAGAIIFTKLAHDQYRASQDTVKQLMAYIVDLTCVMQILLLLVVVRGGEASAEAVHVAVDAYEKTYRPNVHAEISKFPVNIATGLKRRDDVLDKMKELICKYRIPDGDVVRFRRELQSAGVPSGGHA